MSGSDVWHFFYKQIIEDFGYKNEFDDVLYDDEDYYIPSVKLKSRIKSF